MYRITVHIPMHGTIQHEAATIAECLAWYAERIRPEVADSIVIAKL